MLFKNVSIIYRHSASLFQRCLKNFDLNNTEQSVLLFLRYHSGVNQQAIGQYFQFNKATVTKALAALEKKGFIAREINSESKREKCVHLTEEGLKALEAIIETRKCIEDAVMEEFTEAERQQFDTLSERIAEKVWQMTQGRDAICGNEKKQTEDN